MEGYACGYHGVHLAHHHPRACSVCVFRACSSVIGCAIARLCMLERESFLRSCNDWRPLSGDHVHPLVTN